MRGVMAGSAKFSRRAMLALSSAWLAACGGGSGGEGLSEGETGRVVDVRDGDALVLDAGLVVRLAEIEAPRRAWRDRPADVYGEAAAELLEYAALGRQARIFYGGLSRDRYERALAHVVVRDETGEEIWLNGYMTRQGGARVRSYADNCARARALYPLEAEAREAGVGLWAHPEYNVLSPQDLSRAQRGFAVVEGVLAEATEAMEADSRATGVGDGLALRLGYGLARAGDRLDLAVGRRVRLRGYVRPGASGANVALDHWAQIELLG